MKVNKYIRTHHDEIVVFPATLKHSLFRGLSPVSAGFIAFDNDAASCVCTGRSETLDLDSDPIDSSLATKQFFNHF